MDLKSARIQPAKLSQAISAFANTDGGELYIGIEDDKAWKGFEKQEEANGLTSVIFDMFPVQDYLHASFLTGEGQHGYVLKLEIFRTPDVKFATNGNAYTRFGAQNRKVAGSDAIMRLKYTKGVHSFEDELVNDSIEDVVNSLAILEFSLSLPTEPEPIEWLKKQKLISGGRANVAAYMLFGEEPQIEFPKAAVKIYRYKTAAPEGTRDTLAFDPKTIDGPLVSMISEAVKTTKEAVQDIPKIGAVGLESVVYPEEAIHEVLTNAVLHRDYSAKDEVHIRIFDNRIEIFSPGKLPGYVTPQNILKERFARNPKMVRIANKFPNAPNKDIGEGLNTTFEKMRELKLRDPVIAESEAGVTVTLFHELLASPEEIISKYLVEHGEINNSKAREICREGSENKIKRVFERMMGSEIIERIPGKRGRATSYRLKVIEADES
ncbi:ATP-binding protein [Shimia ponticola]|uniref:ATP-binding protein n=1 Tax=Shimia ponticola TaxID=2582893 RepID=UPI00164A9594|nr:ATP-binding protein [Shimia ponticola]